MWEKSASAREERKMVRRENAWNELDDSFDEINNDSTCWDWREKWERERTKGKCELPVLSIENNNKSAVFRSNVPTQKNIKKSKTTKKYWPDKQMNEKG